jgi:hypothetical protein
MRNQSNPREPGDARVESPRDTSLELYHEHRKQAWQDIQTSTDQFDRSLLTLSSGALALSLAFIKDLVPLKSAVGIWWLYSSWISFVLCMIVTLFSFPLSVKALKINLDYVRKYYIEKKEEYFDKQSPWSKAVSWCSILGGTFFLLGIICTMVFVYENIRRIGS